MSGIGYSAPTPGGGSSPLRVQKYAVAFDDAGLADGADLFTPTVGDVVMNIWVEINEAWDGTTPLIDVGNFVSGYGVFSNCSGALDATWADVSSGGSEAQTGWLSQIGNNGVTNQVDNDLIQSMIYSFTGGARTFRLFPAKFVTTDPVQVCVSTDGTPSGSDPGSTQGAATVYFLLATPTA